MNSNKIDTVLLAGTHRNPKRLIQNTNKAFLTIDGKPLIAYVLRTLLETEQIGKIIAVGPREELEETLKPFMTEKGKIIIIQQRSRMLENVWAGFLTTFKDGNPLPVNRAIDTLLLAGQLPIKKQSHLYIIKSLYATVAKAMDDNQQETLSKNTIIQLIEKRFNEFRNRHERMEWFMGRVTIETLLAERHVLDNSDQGISFQKAAFRDYFLEWEHRFQKQIFVVPADVPLIVPQAIMHFIDACSNYDSDFMFAVARESVLKAFYNGSGNLPGIARPYMLLREAKIRAANLVLVKPNRIGNKELIQESFGVRKMTEWRNVMQAIWKLVKQKNRYQTLRLAILLQLASV
ncbi:NTP transferase domain-containing protein, partial [bacterium]|nr:NTP transferase domain-containing protein [candidate division CSSED10-310 bacterium]